MAQRRPQSSGKRKKTKSSFWVKSGNYYDYALLFVILFLVIFGLVMIYSTSSFTAESKTGTPFYYLQRQGIFAIIGILAMLMISNMDYHKLKSLTLLAMYGTLFLLVFVLIAGTQVNGSTRWIKIGPIQFQPSEIAKLAITMYVAHQATIKSARLRDWKVMAKILIPAIVAVSLIAFENLSTGIICAAVAVAVVFVASPSWKHFIVMFFGAAAFMGVFLLLASYRMERIKVWWNPEDYAESGGYQTMQALYAIGSGGLFGKGLGQSIQKLGFIPESHNDYIFSVVCEELGMFGAICIIAVFVLLIWKCVMIAMNAVDMYGSLLVVGIVTHIAVQVLINIAVVTNFFPPTGVPLPFISYGGTSITLLLCEMGIVLSVARQIKVAQTY